MRCSGESARPGRVQTLSAAHATWGRDGKRSRRAPPPPRIGRSSPNVVRVALPSSCGHRGCGCGGRPCGAARRSVPVSVLDGHVRAGADQRGRYVGVTIGGSTVQRREPARNGGTVVGTDPPARTGRTKRPTCSCSGCSATRGR